jgi:hypothetical protein
VTTRSLQFPEMVRDTLRRRYNRHKAHWLAGGGDWPMTITLGAPSESTAARHTDHVRAWIEAWQAWRGAGMLEWQERRWRSLGTQRLPARVLLATAEDVAAWLGESARWQTAQERYGRLAGQWPGLTCCLGRHFEVLADYAESDFERLEALLLWFGEHPTSNLYPRQLPVAGIDSKWLESRRGVLAELAAAVGGKDPSGLDFYQCCGLRPLPGLIRMRLLDPQLRDCVGGLGDISAPAEEIARLTLPVRCAYIVENLQTGLAFDDLPGAVVVMGLGYGVDQLARFKWLEGLRCIYWGDIDTHGLAILSRARSILPQLESLLMDEATLLGHRALWGEEKQPHSAASLACLTDAERSVYDGLKRQRWGYNVRLEQERIGWREAWRTIKRSIWVR